MASLLKIIILIWKMFEILAENPSKQNWLEMFKCASTLFFSPKLLNISSWKWWRNRLTNLAQIFRICLFWTLDVQWLEVLRPSIPCLDKRFYHRVTIERTSLSKETYIQSNTPEKYSHLFKFSGVLTHA